jgi:hypothetical protein
MSPGGRARIAAAQKLGGRTLKINNPAGFRTVVSDRRAFRFKKGASVFVSAGTTVWIVEQIGIDGTSYMIATSSGSVKILD